MARRPEALPGLPSLPSLPRLRRARDVQSLAEGRDAHLSLRGRHWLLATNDLQHAHAGGRRPNGAGAPRDTSGRSLNYARDFEGLVNPLLFNIGLHTAHHENPHAH